MPSQFKTKGSITEITLTNCDKVAIIDSEFEAEARKVRSWNGIFNKTKTEITKVQGWLKAEHGSRRVLLHHLVLGDEYINAKAANPKIEVDHRDRNPLNNLRSNLRLVSASTNIRNQRVRGKVGSRGVYWNEQAKKFKAKIQLPSKKSKHLGYFSNEADAAAAYKRAFQELYPEEVAAVFQDGVEEGEKKAPVQTNINNFFAPVDTVNQNNNQN
jgi:hypothetical protein